MKWINKYSIASFIIWIIMIIWGFIKGIGFEVIAGGLTIYFIFMVIIVMIETTWNHGKVKDGR